MLKKRSAVRLLLAVGLLTISSVRAELGLQSILSSDGVTAVGKTVKSAVESIYSSVNNPSEIKSQIVDILNEAVATGDEGAIRYTIVAVMMAGGKENLDLSKSAVDDSDAFKNFPEVTAFTVSAAESMLSGSSEAEKTTKSDESSGGQNLTGSSEEEGGGVPVEELGGGDGLSLFDDGSDADIKDKDRPATPH
ncbi:hypothetical protein [Tichowtungia aerotolerans]|uniref:Uncharacterized protein n=1 Tax=Tichowtungia aerotolerans TaxID=2697043 RepID=A0A6P1M8S8_9BACT|nr:hypothetical protein [Tichowtungia aerotolerans]QHI70291.1 hypothetical protein GT409_12850 [Tichowtungia aerotolerans]